MRTTVERDPEARPSPDRRREIRLSPVTPPSFPRKRESTPGGERVFAAVSVAAFITSLASSDQPGHQQEAAMLNC